MNGLFSDKYALLPLVIALVFLGVSTASILSSTKLRLKIPFSALTLTTFIWQFSWAMLFLQSDPAVGITIVRFGYFFIIFLPTTLYHFLIELSDAEGDRKWLWASYGVAGIFAFFDVFTPYFVKGVYQYYWGFYPMAGLLHPLHVVQTSIVVSRGLYIVYKKSKSAMGRYRHQLRYSVVALLIYFCAAVDYLVNYGVEMYPPGIVFIAVAIGIVFVSITKHNLMDIKVVITRAAATGGAWGIYLIPLLAIIGLRNWFPGPTALYYGIWGTIGAFGFIPFRNWLQTSAYKKFLKFDYNFEETLKSASSLLVFAQDKESVLESVYTLQRNMEIGESYAILRTEDDHFECYVQQYTDENLNIQQTWKARFEATNPLISEFGDVNRRVVKFGELSVATKAQLKSQGVHPRSLLIAIHSFEELQAIFVVGQKLSEEDYTEQDEALFEVYLNQAVTVFERITQNRKLRDQGQRLEGLNHQLADANQELRVLNTQLHEINLELEEKVREAVALAQKHFHQAAFSTLATGMAHEIRNPIAAMVAGAGFMAQSMEGRKENPGEQFGAWNRPIGAKDLLDVTQNDAEKAEQLYSKLQENGALNPHPMILDFKRKIPASIDLGPGYEPVQGPVRLWFKLLGTMGKFFDLVNVVTQQGPRILDITDNMMKYGVSGGGVKSDSFTKLPGITDDMSADIFGKLVQLGYLDPRGGVMPKLGQMESAGTDLLGEELGPDYIRLVPGVIDIIRTTPGAVKRPVKIDDILNDTISIVEGNCRKQKIVLVRDIQAGLPDVAGDEFRLQQGFFNIIYNAIQALELVDDRPRQLSIRAQITQFPVVGGNLVDGIQIQIEDTGPGMDPQTKGKIFNPFFSTKGPTGGKNIGLGLSILYEVVSGHNGYVDVDSELGIGTRFTIYLPHLGVQG